MCHGLRLGRKHNAEGQENTDTENQTHLHRHLLWGIGLVHKCQHGDDQLIDALAATAGTVQHKGHAIPIKVPRVLHAEMDQGALDVQCLLGSQHGIPFLVV
jgi:hypothetical protein